MAEPIDIEALARADMNLLVALEALMQERSVTRAAKRLSLSQSAMSHALGRLRDLFDDELFVRAGQQMVPTPRAVALAEHVRAALAAVGAALRPSEPFRLETVAARFHVSAFDFAQLTLLPELVHVLAAEAPGVQLVVQPFGRDPVRALADGEIDLVIGIAREPPEPCQAHLSSEPFACVVRRGHPCLDAPLTPERYAALPHAVVSPVGRPSGYVDAALTALGLAREVVFATPQLMSAALATARSDMILTGLARQLRALAALLPLEVLAPPVDLPTVEVAMVWHERKTDDALHCFVRNALATLAAAPNDGGPGDGEGASSPP